MKSKSSHVLWRCTQCTFLKHLVWRKERHCCFHAFSQPRSICYPHKENQKQRFEMITKEQNKIQGWSILIIISACLCASVHLSISRLQRYARQDGPAALSRISQESSPDTYHYRCPFSQNEHGQAPKDVLENVERCLHGARSHELVVHAVYLIHPLDFGLIPHSAWWMSILTKQGVWSVQYIHSISAWSRTL